VRTAAGGAEGVVLVSGSAFMLDEGAGFIFEDLDLVEGRSMVYFVVMRVCYIH
jgi:hypothetical protein